MGFVMTIGQTNKTVYYDERQETQHNHKSCEYDEKDYEYFADILTELKLRVPVAAQKTVNVLAPIAIQKQRLPKEIVAIVSDSDSSTDTEDFNDPKGNDDDEDNDYDEPEIVRPKTRNTRSKPYARRFLITRFKILTS
jgi:hypothetical protein